MSILDYVLYFSILESNALMLLKNFIKIKNSFQLCWKLKAKRKPFGSTDGEKRQTSLIPGPMPSLSAVVSELFLVASHQQIQIASIMVWHGVPRDENLIHGRQILFFSNTT